MTAEELRAKYKCTAPDNGGWCNGTKVGSRMRCPKYLLTKRKEGVCQLGIDEGYARMESLACTLTPPTEEPQT